LDIGIISTLVGIEDLKLFNPAGFEDKLMLDMPEIYVDYDLPAILGGKIHLNDVRLEMKEFYVVKNAKGELNLNSLNVVKQQKAAEPAAGEKGKMPEMQIDSLTLKIGKVVYKDYSKGGAPQVQEFNIGLDEKYSDINDPQELVSLIVVKALANTTIAKLANFDVKGLQSSIGDTLASAQKIVGTAQDAFNKVSTMSSSTLSGTSTQVQSAIKDTTQTAQNAVKDITEAIKLPFGSKEE
ncbi:MAG TPA: hypothetical protein PKZ41_03555, partial [Candidatus Omnitrophota bacterium]|nr:hypothetical protein [Candidatus Omnitrophota bacterium]